MDSVKHKHAIEFLRCNGFAEAADDLERLDEIIVRARELDFWAATHDGRLQTDYRHDPTLTIEDVEDGEVETITYPGVKLPEKGDDA